MLNFKQWGMQRTGTNFTRVLLEVNFYCRVFMSVLGGKHRMPEDPWLWLDRNTRADDVVWEGKKKTKWKGTQLREILEDEGLIHTISIRNPWSFIEAWGRHKGENRPFSEDFIRNAVERYVRHYSAWLSNPNHEHLFIFPMEELALNPVAVLRRFVQAHNIPVPEQWKIPTKKMSIGDDKSGVRTTNCTYKPDPLISKLYVQDIPDNFLNDLGDAYRVFRDETLVQHIPEHIFSEFYQEPVLSAGPIHHVSRRHHTDKNSHGYMPLYNTWLSGCKDTAENILELGVRGGQSVRLWKDWFPHACITGIDIDPDCKKHAEKGISIYQGDQRDSSFLKELSAGNGPWDVIIDDASHVNSWTITSFRILWPELKKHGVYVIEDLGCMDNTRPPHRVSKYEGLEYKDEELKNSSTEIDQFTEELDRMAATGEVTSWNLYKNEILFIRKG